MNADEMLKELGYELDNINTNYIQYYKDRNELYGESLFFDLNFKTFMKYHVTMPELQAITQKCKELGWLEGDK